MLVIGFDLKQLQLDLTPGTIMALFASTVLLADDNKLFDTPDNLGLYVVGGAVAIVFLFFLMVVLTYGMWFQYMSNAR
jgi:hypothetical protein